MNVINEILDVIVIGAGQAGLACGWHLQQQNLRFLILDAERSPGGNWRNYYDSLKLFLQLLTRHCQACASRQNLIITRFVMMSYAIWKTMQRHSDCQFVSTPACSMYEERAGCFSFKRTMEKFSAQGAGRVYGGFNQPFIPDIQGLQGFLGRSLHSAEYRNAEGFGDQRVVVVGAANSAVQIAYELAHVSKVVLASREPIRFFHKRYWVWIFMRG